MNNEKKLLLAEYIINSAASSKTPIPSWKINGIVNFLDTDNPISRTGYLHYRKEHMAELVGGPVYHSNNAAVCDFLNFLGIGFSRKKKKENTVALEKLSVITEKNKKKVNDFLLWLTNNNDFAISTIRSYQGSVEQFFTYSNDFNQDFAKRFIKSLEEKSYKPKTINLRITALEKFAEFAKVKINLKRPKIPKTLSTDNIPTEQEYQRLLDYCFTKSKLVYFWVKLLACTGARVSEFIQFTFEDVERGEVTLKGKGSKYRRFFFQKALSKEITQYAKENSLTGYIARNKDGFQCSTSNIRQYLVRYGVKAGIDRRKVHPHAFRHFFAKMFLKKNKDIIELADLLGHGSVDTTRIYLQKSYDEQKRNFDKSVTW